MQHSLVDRRQIMGAALGAVLAATTECTPFHDDTGGDAGAAGLPSTPPAEAVATDAQGPPCDPNKPFGSPTFVAGLANTMLSVVGGLRLSPDGLTAYFDGAATGYSALYTAERMDLATSFGRVTPIPGVVFNSNEVDPTLGSNGLTLIFSMQAGSELSRFHYLVRDTSSARFLYAGLLLNVNDGNASDEHPFLREDGQVLYFSSIRGSSPYPHIYRASGGGSTFGPPAPVVELSSSFGEYAPIVTPDDKTIYFGSTRSHEDASSPVDIWVSTRATGRLRFRSRDM